ncbi:DNA topoisomerase I [Candidatus Nomurabacteria bacterium RIFCSPLOWO2_01_FULL_42_20]|nr:MAG: DNA topoisomerase I [Candidatus Nomurabacteria bacterium RIFCSPLOWO2_01_FULL_42_20]
MKLLIVESPSKAKTIEKYLDKKFTVRASVGHIRDLPKSNKKAIDIKGGFIPHYEISKGKEHIIDELSKLARKSDEVVLATDPDREGEAIAWHLKEALGLKKPKRIVFHEITKEAVNEALKHPRDIDQNLKTAQEARRVLDRLFGYDLSGLIWKKVRYGLSAGRVQSPALRIIMEREREIRAFVPEKYWVLSGLFKTKKEESLALVCIEEPRDEKLVEKILELGNKNDWFVKDVKESEQKRVPRAPFTTSTLQQTASSRLGYSPSRTMQIAQKLYEAGHITYMRTDSTALAASATASIISLIEKKYGKEYAEAHFYKAKSKNAQEAHEAVRPTHAENMSAGSTPEQEKLYKLIWERAVSSQMADAKLAKTKIIANISSPSPLQGEDRGEVNLRTSPHSPPYQGGEEIPDFVATGSRLLFPGWLKVDSDARGEDVELPKVEIGEKLKLEKLESTEKQTEPPPRYSEAGLVKELEARDIGRPSTYASIIKTLEERGYVTKENRTLFPTDTGEVVSDFIEKNFSQYISDTFTALMEDELDDIALGKCEYVKTLKDFYTPFSKSIKEKEKLEKATTLGDAPKDILCPKCSSPMVIKLGRGGKFYSCSRYPDCEGALTMEGKELQGPKETGEMCPQCGEKHKGKLVEREGKFGKFISCSRYPKCKYIQKSKEEEEKAKTGVKCPVCKTGEIVERRGRFGIFYSCSNYPDCKFAMKAKPTGKICDLCGSLMMQGTKTIPERCSNVKCPNNRPDKLNKIK